MLQFDIRVTVRDPITREILNSYTQEDLNHFIFQIESMLDEVKIIKEDGGTALLTIAMLKEVK